MLISRGSLVGIASGAVLLAGMVGFAVGLPEITDEPAGQAAEDGLVEHLPVDQVLPESLMSGALVRPDTVDPSMSEAGELDEYSRSALADLLGVDVALARYITPDLRVQLTISVADMATGFFAPPFGAPLPEDSSLANGIITKAVRLDDAKCAELYQAEGYTEESLPIRVDCQLGDATRTYHALATGGVTAEQVVEILDEVVAADKA